MRQRDTNLEDVNSGTEINSSISTFFYYNTSSHILSLKPVSQFNLLDYVKTLPKIVRWMVFLHLLFSVVINQVHVDISQKVTRDRPTNPSTSGQDNYCRDGHPRGG
jgi:hypothetical protein